MRLLTLSFLDRCRINLLIRLGQDQEYKKAIQKAEQKAAEEGMTKKPKKIKYPRMPKIENDFLLFFANIMLIKSLLNKFGYSKYWKVWNFNDCIDSAFLLLVRGYEI